MAGTNVFGWSLFFWADQKCWAKEEKVIDDSEHWKSQLERICTPQTAKGEVTVLGSTSQPDTGSSSLLKCIWTISTPTK